jgi:hypothetical protein
MTELQSIRIAGFMNTLCPGDNYYSQMAVDDDQSTPKQNMAGEFLNHKVMPESWLTDGMERLLTVADKLDYSNLLKT